MTLLTFAADKPPVQDTVATPLQSDHLHNLFELSPRLLSGSAPLNEQAFAELAHRGVKTIVSVDGSRPDVETAHKYGMKYVHIPIRYDGIETQSAQSMARVAKDIEGRTYIHCHHGKHRGPAAAAVIGMACDVFNHEQAERYLKQAGTSPKYGGLYRDVARFEKPGPDVKLPELVEIAQVPDMAANMAQVSHAWEAILAVQENHWKDLPDASYTAHEQAVLVMEGLRESQRNVQRPDAKLIVQKLHQSEQLADELSRAIKEGNHKRAGQLIGSLSGSCSSCHAEFRN